MTETTTTTTKKTGEKALDCEDFGVARSVGRSSSSTSCVAESK